MQTVCSTLKRPPTLVCFSLTLAPSTTTSLFLNMDLMAYLTRSRDIQRLLCKHPKSDWPRVVKGVLLYGYYALKAQKQEGISLSDLEAKVRKTGKVVFIDDQLIPTIRQQLKDVKSEINQLNLTIDPPAAPSPPQLPHPSSAPDRPTEEGYRQAFPASKQPGKHTLIFRDTTPPQLRPGLGNYAVMRSNDQWGPQWNGEDYQEEIYPKWWLDMGKMQAEGETTGKITLTPAPILKPDYKLPSRPTVPPSHPVPIAHILCETQEDPEIEVEDASVQIPSLQSSHHPPQPPVTKGRPTRANYSGWIGDFSDLVKRSPGSMTYTQSIDSDIRRSYNPHIEAQIAQKDYEMSNPRQLEGSSGSSMSTYRPTDEVKRFYRAEYPRFAQSGYSSVGSSEAFR